jgi:hypothetical protein
MRSRSPLDTISAHRETTDKLARPFYQSYVDEKLLAKALESRRKSKKTYSPSGRDYDFKSGRYPPYQSQVPTLDSLVPSANAPREKQVRSNAVSYP